MAINIYFFELLHTHELARSPQSSAQYSSFYGMLVHTIPTFIQHVKVVMGNQVVLMSYFAQCAQEKHASVINTSWAGLQSGFTSSGPFLLTTMETAFHLHTRELNSSRFSGTYRK